MSTIKIVVVVLIKESCFNVELNGLMKNDILLCIFRCCGRCLPKRYHLKDFLVYK